jgi:catechol 2,3-dioxygenase-like lactoylglutathione lyase family enzyme
MTAVIPIGQSPRAGVEEQRGESAASTGIRFHLSLNVADLDAAMKFFRAFFGVEPAKCRPDYAKFELHDPPLVLSLEPFKAQPGGNLNHLGFRMPDSASLVEVQRRLELAGIQTRREEGVECCYARQTKFWVHDPDGNLWEVYTLDEDLEHRGEGHIPLASPTEQTQDGVAPAIWAHRLGEHFPVKLFVLDQSVDRISLQGTFNEPLAPEMALQRLKECHRILKPGGTLHLHLLCADADIGDTPLRLPGPAAAVKHVPVHGDLVKLCQQAGFADAHTTLLAEHSCFEAAEIPLRETRIEGTK